MASEPLQKFLIRPGSAALASAALTYVLYGQGDITIPVGGIEMSAVAGIATCVFVSDILAEVIDGELKKSDQIRGMVDMESGLIRPVITGVTLLAASSVLIGPQAGPSAMVQVFGIGALSQVTGSYVYDITNGLYTK
jgi:hypothetical protein